MPSLLTALDCKTVWGRGLPGDSSVFSKMSLLLEFCIYMTLLLTMIVTIKPFTERYWTVTLTTDQEPVSQLSLIYHVCSRKNYFSGSFRINQLLWRHRISSSNFSIKLSLDTTSLMASSSFFHESLYFTMFDSGLLKLSQMTEEMVKSVTI